MLNAMSQGRAGSMCTVHADSSHGVFRRLASYAVQSPQRLPLEATNLLVAGAVHFVVFVDVQLDGADTGRLALVDGHHRFTQVARRRFVSSVLEVVDADGVHIVSNEVFRPGPDGPAVAGAPLRERTAEALGAHGFRFGVGEAGWEPR